MSDCEAQALPFACTQSAGRIEASACEETNDSSSVACFSEKPYRGFGPHSLRHEFINAERPRIFCGVRPSLTTRA
jgi:hypothetical protein